MQRENVGRDALLFTWRGTDSTLAPILLMGHMDVVPVAPGTDSLWKHGAFSGDIADGFIWGRGSLDDKGTVLGVLEACEALIASGFKPSRTIILSFGADEEAGGESGAKVIAALLESRGIKPLFVLDEGGTVVKGAIGGITKPVALIGIAEKGYLTVEMKVRAEGGHSSMPPKHTAAGILATAITRLEGASDAREHWRDHGETVRRNRARNVIRPAHRVRKSIPVRSAHRAAARVSSGEPTRRSARRQQ